MAEVPEWMTDAACVEEPGLPWVGVPGDDWSRWVDPPGDLARMQAICAACPVRSACAAYVIEAKITDGFWAGHWQRPTPQVGRGAA